MRQSLGGFGRVLLQCWPALLAWYLGGSLVRAAVITLAAPIGPQSALAALLLVPIAVLAKLVSYIGMFLVIRRALRSYSRISLGDVSFTSLRDAASEFLTVLVASILPFFALYTLIGGLSDDLGDYARSAFLYSLGSGNNVVDVGDGPLVVAVVLVAYGARMALKFFGPKLPRWVAIIEIYLEATWVFVALSGISAVFGTVVNWISNRQVVFWVTEAREQLRELWVPIRLAIDGVDWLVPSAVQLVLLPLAWLLIAGVIYTRALSTAVDERLVSVRLEARLRGGVARLPLAVQRRLHLFSDEWDDIGGPLAMAGRMIVRAGPLGLAVFVFAYGVIFAISQWMQRTVFVVIGANDAAFASVFVPVVSLATSAITEPLRIALLAVAFDWCLRKWNEKRAPVPAVDVTVDPPVSAATPGRED